MSQKVPPSWFDSRLSDADKADEEHRRKQLETELPDLLAKIGDRGRAQNFQPYLLVRSVLGDRGDRPIGVPFWESPDIWTAPGDPAAAPEAPPDRGGTVQAGVPNTLYAHVWNIGFAPLAGVRVEFYWFDPSLAIDDTHSHLIGVARCELAARGMAGSHRLVKCPSAWVPVMANGGHECLMVRISGVGDQIGNNPWQPWQNRHVAQRNISVIAAGTTQRKLLASLERTRKPGTRLQLIQLGPREGGLAARLVAPKLKVADIETQLLAELTASDEIEWNQSPMALPGMFAPVHEMAHGVKFAPPDVRKIDDETQIVSPRRLLRDLQAKASVDEIAKGKLKKTLIADLLYAVDRLHKGRVFVRPKPGLAFVFRIASYRERQLIGGYTLVIGVPDR
jgi:hypothetical protein